MELDDLKNIWQRQTTLLAERQALEPAEMQRLLSAKATDLVSRLRRNLLFEYYFTLAALVVAVALLFFDVDFVVKIGAVMTVGLATAFTFYYRKQLKLLRQFFPLSGNLKQSLTVLLQAFRQYVRLYRRAYRWLVPAAMLLGLAMGGQLTTGDNFIKLLTAPLVLGMVILVLVALVFLMDWGIKWYLRYLYGKHLERLDALLKDLEKE